MNAAWLDRWLDGRWGRTRLRGSRPGIRFVPTSGGEVRLRHQPGPGPRMLVGADGPDCIEHHDDLLAALQDVADVIVYEPPGTGGSLPGPGFSHRIDEHARVVEEVVVATGGPRHLVMPCWLGFVAGRVDPRHIASLTLPQTPTWTDMGRWADRVDPRRVLRTPVLGQLFVALWRRPVIEGWYHASVGHREQLPHAVSTAQEVLASGGCFGLASLVQALQSEAPERPSQGIVLWGERDRTHRSTDPGPDAHRFVDAGHRPHLEEPQRFATWWREVVER